MKGTIKNWFDDKGSDLSDRTMGALTCSSTSKTSMVDKLRL